MILPGSLERGRELCVRVEEEEPVNGHQQVYSQINKYILGRHPLPASQGVPMGPSIEGGAGEDRPGWVRLPLSGTRMPVSQGPPPRKGSLESGRFEGAEAKKASMLTNRVSVTGSHFNDSGGRPLRRRKGHPGLQQGQHVARKELRGGNSYHPRWLPSVGVRAQGFPSQGTFGGEQAPVPFPPVPA